MSGCDQNLCRICLNENATIPIFKNEKYNIVFKLSTYVNIQIEDVPGGPRNICTECNNILEMIEEFIKKYHESQKVLEQNFVNVKEEDVEELEEEIEDLEEESQDSIDFLESFEEEEKSKGTFFDIPVKLEDGLDTEEAKIEAKLRFLSDTVTITKIKIEPNAVCKKKRSLKTKPRNKNLTNKISSSILEGEFEWTGEKWCLNSTNIKSNYKRPIKLLKRNNIVRDIKLPKVHEPAPPKLCDLCGEVFNSTDKLNVHKKKVHLRNPIKCPECGKMCCSEYYLSRHRARKHGKEKNFICTSCGQRFAFRGEMTSHYKNVHLKHLKPKKTWSCKICGKTYKCPKSVIIHERSVHTGYRPAVCSVCDSSFFHEDYLKEHMRLHTGETPFKCPVCQRGYAQRCNMKSHIRIHKISELDPELLSKIKPNYLRLMKA